MSTVNISSSSFSIVSDSMNKTVRDPITKSTCMAVNLSAFRLHDDSKDVMSTTATSLVNNVLHVIFFPALFLIGFPSNVVNMAVFVSHGLKQRINLCLFCLSLMDFIFVNMAFFLYVEKLRMKDFTTSYRNFGFLTKVLINNRVLGLYTGAVFSSQFVSAVIAGERCLCVVWPFRANAVLKTKTVGVFLLVGSLLIFAGRVLTEMKHHLVCVEDIETGLKSFLATISEFYRDNKNLINILDGTVYGLCLPVILCTFVIVTTIITAVTLQQSSQFQKESSSSSTTALSARNVAVTKMLIYLSLQFIVLNTPNILFRVSLLFLPELNTTRNWANLYFFFIGLTGLCGMLSSSLNFLVYYFFGSKYRESVQAMLCSAGRRRQMKL